MGTTDAEANIPIHFDKAPLGADSKPLSMVTQRRMTAIAEGQDIMVQNANAIKAGAEPVAQPPGQNTSLVISDAGLSLLMDYSGDPKTGGSLLSEARVNDLKTATQNANLDLSAGYTSIPAAEFAALVQNMTPQQRADISTQTYIFKGRDAFTDPSPGRLPDELWTEKDGYHPRAPEPLPNLLARIAKIKNLDLKQKVERFVQMGHIFQRHVVSIEALKLRVLSNYDPASGTKWDAIHPNKEHESSGVATGFKTDADAILFIDRVLQTTQFQNFKMKAQAKFGKPDPNDPKIEVYSAGLHIPLSSLLDGRKANQYFLGLKALKGRKTAQDVDFTGGRLTVEFVAEVHNGELKIRIDTMYPAEKR